MLADVLDDGEARNRVKNSNKKIPQKRRPKDHLGPEFVFSHGSFIYLDLYL